MPYILEDLVINRVDLVDEGANSAAFIELYKRKEQSKMDVNEILSKMKPEHSSVILAAIDEANAALTKAKEDLATVTSERDTATAELEKAKEALDTANEDLETAKSELETLKAEKECDSKKGCGGSDDDDETETMKSMPENLRAVFEKMKAQKDAAEEELRKAKEAEQHATAVAKAAELKAIPVEQDKLVGIIKGASPEVLELLTAVNAVLDEAVLGEFGKNHSDGRSADAWSQLEAKAEEIAKRDSISKEKAISIAIKENPDVYRKYLHGGAK